ncbi:hypothetical protein SAY86_025389 [Trapa natans]|uniref:Uncharacterized protein n=1 Tax=Trapa natans TaxID=22666 RepID=A0AAN7M881_TRANT|nr:hypothetical protein SAY86_025389 [Trapa natans]
MGRPPCCDKSNVKRGLWTAEEDAKILAYVSAHGTGNWTLVPKKAGLNRCGKSCRLRWTNYLRPDLKHESFTLEEEQLIINFHKAIGSRWSMIARQLPGRTDNDVKNYWNTKLRKKLAKMGIDPVTHKPIPQVMSEYGNVSRLPTSTSSTNPGSVPQISNSTGNHNPAWNQLLCQNQESMIDQKIVQPQHFPNDVSSSSSSSTVTRQFLDSSKQGCSILSGAPCPPFTLPNLLPVNRPWVDNILQGQGLCIQQDIFSPAIDTTQTEHPAQCSSKSTLGSGLDGDKATYLSNIYDPLYGAPSGGQQDHWYEASSLGNSFVDSILHRDSQIQQEFPELLDALLDY